MSVNRVLQCYGDDWSTLSEHFSESPEVCEYFLTPAALFRLFDRATQIELRRDAHIAEARLECTQQRVYPSLDRNPDQIGIPTGWEERAAFVMANKQLEKTAETMRATVALGAHAFGYRLRHDWRVEA